MIAEQDVAIRQDGPAVRSRERVFVLVEVLPLKQFAPGSRTLAEIHATQRGICLSSFVNPPVASEEQTLGLFGPDSRFMEAVPVLRLVLGEDSKLRTGRLKQAPKGRVACNEW